ncbi:uncharacterized protein OCT59_004578 [Rhizophagus irregularis]|uniref:uncharacterized protein n=1 Tax=Rhizophagus irregularis TaxID=588596 RepID=UPI00332F5564|nr:hypothetical protein OCT59_004578 [Rhizophagus irregularis]
MDEIKLSDDVIEQIKDFDQWIEYDKFEDVEYLAKGGFGTVFKAVWKDGPWETSYSYQVKRKGETKVALKCSHNLQSITTEFLKEVESNILACKFSSGHIVRYFGITKDPKTNNFIMVMELKNGSLRQHLNNDFISLNWYQKLMILLDPLKRPKADELRNLFARLWSYCDKSDSLISEQAKEANKINKKSSSKVQLPLSSTGALQYMTHPQAVYTSRILDFKNLPEPKNADNNDDLLEMEYSDSLRVDFTKYDINSKDESN